MQHTVPSYLPSLQQPHYASYNLLKNKVHVHIQRIQPNPQSPKDSTLQRED